MAMLVVALAGATWRVADRRSSAPPVGLDVPGPATGTLLADPVVVAKDTSGDVDHDDPWQSPAAAPAASPTPRHLVGPSSPADRARALMLGDPAAARKLLEPRVAGGQASRDEIVLLLVICKTQQDQGCVQHCRQLLGSD